MNKTKSLTTATFILLAALFTACEEEEVFDPPLVLTSEGGVIVLDEGVSEYTLTGTVQSQAGLSEVALLELIDDQYFQLEEVTSFEDPSQYSYSFTITEILDTTVVVVEATDTEFQTSTSDPVTFVYTPIPETPLTEAEEAEWKRIAGNPGTGLDQFGLAWTDNIKTVKAVIKKDGAEKFVQLDESDWEEIETLETLTEKVEDADDMDDYRGVSAFESATYNDVLAVVYNEEYFLILVESATVESTDAGTVITISIQFKTADTED